MHFHEHSIHSSSDSSAREWFDVFRLSAGCMTKPAGKLQLMSHIKNDGGAKLSHNGKRSHVNYEVVIAETDTALG